MNPLNVLVWLAVGVLGFVSAAAILIGAGFLIIMAAVRVGQVTGVPANDVLLMMVVALAAIAVIGAAITYCTAKTP